MTEELSAELVERCRHAVERIGISGDDEAIRAVLREARYAELVAEAKTAREAQLMDYKECGRLRAENRTLKAALKFVQDWIKDGCDPEATTYIAAKIDATLKDKP